MAKDKEFEKEYQAERLRRTKIRKAKRRENNNGMCKCGVNRRTKPHACPYDEDMRGIYTANCTCCPECEHECAMDI